MRIDSAVLTITDQELNQVLERLDLPVDGVTVRSEKGKLAVKLRKGVSLSFSVVFMADGGHLSATVDAGALANPFVGMVLDRAMEKGEAWGLTRVDRTLVLNPEETLKKAGYQGEIGISRIAVGAGALVIAVECDLPLDQFL